MRTLGALFFLTFLCNAAAWGQVEVALVFPFENNTRNPSLDWIGESFVEGLSTNLSTSRLMMLGRQERTTAFDSMGIPASNIVTNATIYKISQALDANKVILGNYDYSNGEFKAVAQVLSLPGPSLSKSFEETGPLANLLELQAGLAWQIRGFLWAHQNIPKSG